MLYPRHIHTSIYYYTPNPCKVWIIDEGGVRGGHSGSPLLPEVTQAMFVFSCPAPSEQHYIHSCWCRQVGAKFPPRSVHACAVSPWISGQHFPGPSLQLAALFDNGFWGEEGRRGEVVTDCLDVGYHRKLRQNLGNRNQRFHLANCLSPVQSLSVTQSHLGVLLYQYFFTLLYVFQMAGSIFRGP